MPDKWIDYTLAEVVTLQRGFDLPEHSRNHGSVPVLGTFGITGSHNVSKVVGPGVTVGRSGASIGVATYTDHDYWPLNTALYVRDFHGNDPRFVYFLLKSIDFTAYNSGSAQPSLNRNFVAHLPVSLPPKSEQRAIASVLGGIDDKIEANQRTCKLQEELATRVLDQAPNRIPLCDVATIQRNIIDPASFGPTMVDHFSLPAFDEHRLPVHQAGEEIKSGKQTLDDVSVLVSRLNPHIPRIWYAVPEPGVFGVASTEFVVLAPRSDTSAEELWACCNSASFSSALAESVTGTTGSHQRVQAADVLSTEVGDPHSLSSGQRLAIATMVKSAHHLRIESAALEALLDTLRPKLLCGELRVRDAKGFVEAMA